MSFNSDLSIPEHFTFFKSSIENIELPERFTFPFYYEPHPLCVLAATELQDYLSNQKEFEHNFGLLDGQEGLIIGKMFGVLVVQNSKGQLGYLSAFSGKLANENHHNGFVPPVFDLLDEKGFFRTGEQVLTAMTSKIEDLEASKELENLYKCLEQVRNRTTEELNTFKSKIKAAKKERDKQRAYAQNNLSDSEIKALDEQLRNESIKEQYALKDLKLKCKMSLEKCQNDLDVHLENISSLKEERKAKSSTLQKKIFEQYFFINQNKEKKSLQAIFENTKDQKPPAGSGECAAPKLLQYAFENDLKPIAMAEFWWGQSPASEIRIHKHFYPSCRGKCEPILAHMLDGIEMDENPMLLNPAEGKELPIVYEDDYLLVINKPSEFLSVPGKNIEDSVADRMKELYPKATGPMVVHRLDMSTSGLMLIAKYDNIHKHLQSQFIKRTIKKQYVALLDGLVQENDGLIDLPLRVDLEDRPRQLVCYEHGKSAQTKWEVIERRENRTLVRFFPITGRTHQLRVHSAHKLGLNTPILGDDIYGKKADRLHLHAQYLEFRHPVTKEIMQIQAEADF